MKFISTRKIQSSISASEAILQGLASDGGLFVPESLPNNLQELQAEDLPSFAAQALAPFFEGDCLENDLETICREAFNFPLPIHYFDQEAGLLNLFEGPTAAFKDFGARFLARSMGKAVTHHNEKEKTILVATSGDTGGAVAAAFYGVPGIKVAILFPSGLVSPRQEQQLTCWGENIQAFKVNGTFDDCQAIVKSAFAKQELNEQFGLTSANSINIGRILPQMAYQAYAASLFYREKKKKPIVIIPTGNLGNAMGAFWAKAMGSPIEKIVMAVNANQSIPDYFNDGKFTPRASIPTLANAMDVGHPSNMERLLHLFASKDEVSQIASSHSIDDEKIKETIKSYYQSHQLTLCPHTAVGIRVWQDHYKEFPCLINATAHPAKFESIIEPLLGTSIEIPSELSKLMAKESSAIEIGPELKDLIKELK